MGRLASVLLLLVAGCGSDPAPRSAPNEPLAADADDSARPPTPFSGAPAVFDTTEPPEQVVQIVPRPEPPPAARPDPTPPAPRPPPPPASGGPSGSCDVRGSEGFCFTYTGAGWSPRDARANCAEAPGADFSPGTCPTEGRIATCAFRRPSAPDREIVYTYYEPFDPVLAELACPGTFTRLP